MKKFIPYILAYLIVAAGTTIYAHFSSDFFAGVPPNSVTVMSTLPQDQLLSKLYQAGFHHAIAIKPAPAAFSLVYHFLIFAIYFAAFAGLAHLFRRAFRTDVPVHDHDFLTPR
jgi:hypothetical protein